MSTGLHSKGPQRLSHSDFQNVLETSCTVAIGWLLMLLKSTQLNNILLLLLLLNETNHRGMYICSSKTPHRSNAVTNNFYCYSTHQAEKAPIWLSLSRLQRHAHCFWSETETWHHDISWKSWPHDIHRSAAAWKPLAAKMNDADHLATLQYSAGRAKRLCRSNRKNVAMVNVIHFISLWFSCCGWCV